MKVLFIFGTRPEAIKLAPVIKKAQELRNKIETVTCITAQHRQMLDQVINLFDIAVDYDLNIMKNDQSVFDVTINGLSAIKEVLELEKPNFILTQGDTTTTFVGSLAAFYLKIPVGHVEAGLRTNNKYQPFPEEINRRLTTHIADLHFAPTKHAKMNLLSEGIKESKIIVTGNTVIDALKIVAGQCSQTSSSQKWENYFCESVGISLDNCRLILVTSHRRENFGQGFENICHALKEIGTNNADVQIVYPVHLNPNVQKPVRRILSEVDNIHLIEPLEYAPFVYLMTKSFLILTDSGGIQEEAPALGKPVLVMREITERPEAIAAGTARLVGTKKNKIVRETQRLLEDNEMYRKMSRAQNLYGDGKASERIVKTVSSFIE